MTSTDTSTPRPPVQRANRLHGVAVRRVDRCRAECGGQLQFHWIDVHAEHLGRAQRPGQLKRRRAEAADAKDRDGFPALEARLLQRVKRGRR